MNKPAATQEVKMQDKLVKIKPVQAERRSSRQKNNGVPEMEKAMKLKAAKDATGSTNNPFLILQQIDNSHLANIAVDCNIMLGEILKMLTNSLR